MHVTVSKLHGLLQADSRQIFSAYIVNTGNSDVEMDPVMTNYSQINRNMTDIIMKRNINT